MNRKSDDGSTPPLFSIVIPAFNEEEHIKKCLDSISSLEYDLSLCEVIVVDNGSTDRTLEIISGVPCVRCFCRPQVNVGAVRNYGAACSRAEILVFIDADCLVDPGWLKRAEKLSSDHPSSAFGGGAKLPKDPKWIEKYWLLEKKGRPVLPKHLIGASIVVSKDIFNRVGGFNEKITSGEDTDFHNRLIASNTPVKFTHDLDVIHLGNAKSLKSFLARQSWHAENYLADLKNSTRDIIFWLTVGYSVTVFLLPFFVMKNPGLALLATQFPPMLLTAKRLYRARILSGNPMLIFSCLVIDNIYLAGRFLGIVHSIRKNLK